MPNFQAPITNLTTTIMGAAVAMPMAEERYTNKQIDKATKYAEKVKPTVEGAEAAGAANKHIASFGKYVPAAYKQTFERSIAPVKQDVLLASNDNLRAARAEEAMERIPTDVQERWAQESDAEQRAMIARRQATINKSKATKILPRDILAKLYTDYAQQQKEEDKDGE